MAAQGIAQNAITTTVSPIHFFNAHIDSKIPSDFVEINRSFS